MPELIQCPQCRQQLRLPSELLDKRVQCPSCTYIFLAPVPENPPPIETAILAEPEEPRSRRRVRERYDDDDVDEWEERHYRRDLPEHRGGVILALGICSLLLGCIGLVRGPIAWTMGNTDLAAMRAGRMDPEGEGLTNAGRICGIIGTVLGGVGLCFSLIWFASFAAVVANAPAGRPLP